MPYAPHDRLPAPEDTDQTIWRYRNFQQLMSILEHKSLWFTAADRLQDPHEGGFTMPALEYVVEQGRSLGWEFDEEEFMEMIQSSPDHFVKNIYLNSWHMNNYESAAMWEQYSSVDGGIAIRSSVQRLVDALAACDDFDVHISPIEYIDFRQRDVRESHILRRFLYKRKSYRHEMELRALFQLNDVIEVDTERAREEDVHLYRPHEPIQHYPRTEPYASTFDEPMPPGRPIPVDLDTLIEKIFIAPDAPDWIEGTLKDIVERYGRDRDLVEKSDLKSTLLK